MAADGVEAHDRSAAAARADQDRQAGEDVLQDRRARPQRPGELHPQLGERPARDDGDVVVHPGRDERGGEDERVHRAGAERLHVGSRRVSAARLLGDRLAEVAAAALVAVSDRLLAAAERVRELVRGEAGRAEQVLERERPGRFARQVLEQNGCTERLVLVVRRPDRAGETAVNMEREPTRGRLLAVEPHEAELVARREALVQLRLGHDQPVRAFAPRVGRVLPTRAWDVPERLRPHVPDERLAGRVGKRLLERPQRRGERPEQGRVCGKLAGGLRAVPDEIRSVGEHERAPVDGGAGHEASSTVPDSTSASSSASAASTIRRRSARSIPAGWVIAGPRTTRLQPTIAAIVGNDVTNTVGIPARSNSLPSAAPQRVPVPQVPVSRTASTPASASSRAISRPNSAATATGVPFPVVV